MISERVRDALDKAGYVNVDLRKAVVQVVAAAENAITYTSGKEDLEDALSALDVALKECGC